MEAFRTSHRPPRVQFQARVRRRSRGLSDRVPSRRRRLFAGSTTFRRLSTATSTVSSRTTTTILLLLLLGNPRRGPLHSPERTIRRPLSSSRRPAPRPTALSAEVSSRGSSSLLLGLRLLLAVGTAPLRVEAPARAPMVTATPATGDYPLHRPQVVSRPAPASPSLHYRPSATPRPVVAPSARSPLARLRVGEWATSSASPPAGPRSARSAVSGRPQVGSRLAVISDPLATQASSPRCSTRH